MTIKVKDAIGKYMILQNPSGNRLVGKILKVGYFDEHKTTYKIHYEVCVGKWKGNRTFCKLFELWDDIEIYDSLAIAITQI